MDTFYSQTLQRLLARGWLSREASLLVVCGGQPDQEVLAGLGFSQVTISNLDVRLDTQANVFAPYQWSFQNAEDLKYPDNSFDYCVAHQGLHHCPSPHRALLEMYRVSRKGLLVFEPRDSLLARLGVALGFGQQYEVAAVAGNKLLFGGVDNTAIPNYVYRWTEREVRKAVRSFAPKGAPRFQFFYGLRVPTARLRAMRNRPLAALLAALVPVARMLTWLAPRQSNCFAFAIDKLDLPRDLHPWLRLEHGQAVLNEEWVRRQYGDFQ